MSQVCELFGNQLETEDGELIRVGTPLWRQWLECHCSFHYNPKAKNQPGFTARKEKSRGRATQIDYWYGYRKVDGKLHKRYLGKTKDLTLKRMEQVARLLMVPAPPRLKSSLLTKKYAAQDLEKARDEILKHWRVHRGPETKERIKHALDKLIAKVQQSTAYTD